MLTRSSEVAVLVSRLETMAISRRGSHSQSSEVVRADLPTRKQTERSSTVRLWEEKR